MWWRLSRRPLRAIACSTASRHSRTARSPIAWKCTWKPAASSSGTASFEDLGVDERDARVVGEVAVAVAVRLEHRGGEVLGDAVLHDLDGCRGEASAPVPLAPLEDRRDLLEALRAVPPDRPDHARGERAVGRRREVGGARVSGIPVRSDDGVLPAGDAERVQVALAEQQRLGEPLERLLGQQPVDEGHRALVQRARRVAVGVALDAAVGRVGGVAVDARAPQRGRVHPRAVAVAVREERRAVAGRRRRARRPSACRRGTPTSATRRRGSTRRPGAAPT